MDGFKLLIAIWLLIATLVAITAKPRYDSFHTALVALGTLVTLIIYFS